MATLIPPASATHPDPDWDAACDRLDNYLRALRVADEAHRRRLVERILEKAAARRSAAAGENLTILVMEEARAAMEDWFERILGRRERICPAGLISMLAVDAPARWPEAFLSDELPVEILSEMRRSDVKSGPDLQVSSMVPRPLDVGPLLDPVHVPMVIEKIWRSTAVFAMAIVIAAFTFLIFRFAR